MRKNKVEIKDNDIPELVDHFRYLQSEYFGKMDDEDGALLHVHDIPENLGFDLFLENTTTHAYNDRTSKSFLVPFDEIKNNEWNLSINRYKEMVYEEIEYDAPSDIIKEIEALDQERQVALENLKGLLG